MAKRRRSPLSASICSTTRSAARTFFDMPMRWPATMRERRALTGRPSSRLKRRAWRPGWRACARNSFRRRIGPIRCGGRRSPSRAAANVRSASRRSGIGWFKPPPRSCWSRSSKRTSRTVPYGYRPRRGAVDAVKETHRLLCRGYTDVVDADLSKYFDTIPHSDLLKSVARRIVDRHVLHLIKMWLQAPVEERDGDGKRRISGGKGNRRGTPQGGVVSPLLANIYMNRFLKHWRLSGCGEAFRAHVVSYADDFVILSRGLAPEALAWTRAVMTKLGLTLNEAKTSVKDAR